MRARLLDLLAGLPYRAVACSGGVDSLTLAAAAHRAAPDTTLVVHSVTPAVPAAATARVVETAAAEGWDLRTVRSRDRESRRLNSSHVNISYDVFCLEKG